MQAQIGCISKPFKGEQYCGDQCAYWHKDHKITLCLADGLGHGEAAYIAAKAAVDYVDQHIDDQITHIFTGCNLKIRNTRGVAMGIAQIDEDARELIYAAVGNIRAMIVRVLSSGYKDIHLLSDNGIVGAGYRALMPDRIKLMPDDLVIMFTDGVKDIIDLASFDQALCRDVQKLAHEIIRQWGCDTDDSAVLIYKREVG